MYRAHGLVEEFSRNPSGGSSKRRSNEVGIERSPHPPCDPSRTSRQEFFGFSFHKVMLKGARRAFPLRSFVCIFFKVLHVRPSVIISKKIISNNPVNTIAELRWLRQTYSYSRRVFSRPSEEESTRFWTICGQRR